MKLFGIVWFLFVFPCYAIEEDLLSPEDFTNGLSQSVAAPVLVDPGTLQEDPNRATGGREKKARESSGNGLAGGIVATAIGGTLITVGLGMLASPDTTTQLAGADLIGKGGQELAQGISNIASSGENKDQEKKLLQNTSSPAPQVPSIPATPELDRKLEERGINPDEFKERLVKGDLLEPETILKEFGQGREFTEEEKRAATLLANQELGYVLESHQGAKVEPVTPQRETTEPTVSRSSFSSPIARHSSVTEIKSTSPSAEVPPGRKARAAVEPTAPSSNNTQSAPFDLSLLNELKKTLLGASAIESTIVRETPRSLPRGVNIFDLARDRYQKLHGLRVWRVQL